MSSFVVEFLDKLCFPAETKSIRLGGTYIVDFSIKISELSLTGLSGARF
jgi:hypothetical protein